MRVELGTTELSDVLVVLKWGYHNNNESFGVRCGQLHDRLVQEAGLDEFLEPYKTNEVTHD